MTRRKVSTLQAAFDFEAIYPDPVVEAPLAPSTIDLATDALPLALADEPVAAVDPDGTAPTVMAYGAVGDPIEIEPLLEPEPDGGDYVVQHAHARRDSPSGVAPTILQNNRGQAQILVDVDAPVDAVPSGEKPPYCVPLMSEIAALPPNGRVVVSTFSGCGGSCLGFKMAGYRVIWANEFVPAAQATYRANHPTTYLDVADIRTVTAASIRAVIGDVEIDVLEGSPPCASFSTAGKTSKGWGQVRPYSDVYQRTDDLFDQYVRLLGDLRPRAFVAENVSGMVKGVSKGHFKKYLDQFRDLPYNVEARLLDAQWLGVPQRRVRLIFVGVRKDVGRPTWPRMLPYRYSVREAIPWIARQDDNGGFGDDASCIAPAETMTQGRALNVRRRVERPASIVAAADALGPAIETRNIQQNDSVVGYDVAASLDGYAIAAEYDKLKPGESSSKFFNLVRTDADQPCQTVTAQGAASGAGSPGGVASVAHPYERRKFTIAELRRICGFPDDFVLTGTYAQQWERLGRAVPPPMMRAVAAALLPVLER